MTNLKEKMEEIDQGFAKEFEEDPVTKKFQRHSEELYDLKITEKYKKLLNHFKEERQFFSNILTNTIDKLKNPDELYIVQTEGISARQICVDKKAELEQMNSRSRYELKQKLRDITHSIRTKGDKGLIPKSIDETRIFKNNDVKEFDFRIEIIQSHIDFLTETIKTFDNLNWAVNNRLKALEIYLNERKQI